MLSTVFHMPCLCSACRSDSGSASFLGELWEAVKECAAGEWVVLALPNVHHDYHQKLHSAQPLNGLDMLHLPQGPAGVSTGLTRQQVVVRVRHAYPPRGGIRLLGRAYLEGDLPAIERFIVEEYIIDSLAALSSDRSARFVSSISKAVHECWAMPFALELLGG